MSNNLTEFWRRNRRGIIQIAIFSAFIAAFYFFFRYLFSYVSPFVMGWLISVALFPLAKLIYSRSKIPKTAAAFISLLLAILVVGLIATVIGVKIRKEAGAFANEIPRYLEQVTGLLTSLESSLADITDILPAEVQNATKTTIAKTLESMTASASSLFRQGSISAVSTVPGALFFTLIVIISAVFFTADKERINAFVIRQFPIGWRKTAIIVRHNLFSALAGYVVAECKVACITFFICLIGLLILGFKYALIIALAVAFVDFLPVFGSGFILWPWCAYNLLASNYRFAIGLIIIYLCIQVTRQIVEPRLVGHHIGLHPLVTLMAMYISIRIFGAVGIITGPIFVLTVKALQEEKLLPNWR